MKNNPPHKGYATLYVFKTEDIQSVEDAIKEIDEYEYGYLPKEFIRLWTGSHIPSYTGKFTDICLNELQGKLIAKGVHTWYVQYSGYANEDGAWASAWEMTKILNGDKS